MLCVSVQVKWVQDDNRENRQYATLARWDATLCVRSAGQYAIVREASGTTAEAWWDTFRTATLRSTNLWVMSTRFREAASVLQLWEKMERGELQCVGKDSRKAYAAADSLPNLRPGLPGGVVAEQEGVGSGSVPGMSAVSDSSDRPQQRGRSRKRAGGGAVCILEDPPIVIQLRIGGGGRRATWVDASNYGADPELFGPEPWTESRHAAEWFLSAGRTLQTLGKAGWQSTAGSQAMHLYKCDYLDTPTFSHTSRHATALESGSMFGGRCEPFYIGRVPGNAHLYDIRSLYPFLCTTTAVPIRLVMVEVGAKADGLVRTRMGNSCIARVDVETDYGYYPLHTGGKTVYPQGRFTTYLSGPELAHALRTGRVLGVRQAALYESDHTLRRYAETVYSARCEADKAGDRALSSWLKRLLVSLPGKFAQRVAAWEDMPLAESAFEWGEWWTKGANNEPVRWRSIAGNVQRERREGFSHGTVPAVTSAICAAGRMRLLECIRAAGREHVYYCDTDGIIVSDYGSELLTLAGWVRPGEWGYMQHVVSGDDCYIYGPKNYRIGGHTRRAGQTRLHGCNGGAEDENVRQPWIGESLRHQQIPADWRESHPPAIGPGRYLQPHEPGGWVRPIIVDELDPD